MTKRLPRIILGGVVFCFIASVPSALAGQEQDVRLLKAENKLLKATIRTRDKQIAELKEQVAELKTADAQKKIDALTKELVKVKEQLAALKGKAEEEVKAEPAENPKAESDPNAVTFDKTTHRKIKIPEGRKWELAESPDEKPTGRMSVAYTLGPLPKGIDDKDALRFIAKGELDKTFKGRKLARTRALGKNMLFPGSKPEGTVAYYVFYLGSVKDQAVAISASQDKFEKTETFFDFASCPNECEKKLEAGKAHVLIVKIISNPNWGTKNYVTVAGTNIYQGLVPVDLDLKKEQIVGKWREKRAHANEWLFEKDGTLLLNGGKRGKGTWSIDGEILKLTIPKGDRTFILVKGELFCQQGDGYYLERIEGEASGDEQPKTLLD